MASISTTPTQVKAEPNALVKQLRANLQTYGLIAALILISIFFAVLTNGTFLGVRNISNLFRQMTVTAFLSVGMVLVIVTGNIDLSVGKLAGFISVVAAVLQSQLWPQILPEQELLTTILTVIVSIGVGLFVGLIQGYIIAYLRVPAFIVTLGGLWVFTSLILIVTQGKTIPANQPIISQIAQGYLPDYLGWVLAVLVCVFLLFNMITSRRRKARYGFALAPLAIDLARTIALGALVVGYVIIVNQYHGVQYPVLLLALVAVIGTYISNNTRFGRYAYAIGGNREAARLSGVNIRRNIFTIFVLMGGLCGVAGVVLASYVGYGTTAAGQGYELDAIAACILGGTSTLGGEGTIIGAMVGALIMASLTNGLQLLNSPTEWQYLIKGAVLILAVYADVRLRRNR